MKKPLRGIEDNRILTPVQVAFLNKFVSSDLKEYFRLTGGTPLSAYYLEYRIFEDLDFSQMVVNDLLLKKETDPTEMEVFWAG